MVSFILSYTIYHLSYFTSIAMSSQDQDKEVKEGEEEDSVKVDEEVEEDEVVKEF